jgi:hypothetical protein
MSPDRLGRTLAVTHANSHRRDWVEPPPLHEADRAALADALRERDIVRESWLYGHLITEQDGSQRTTLAVGFVIQGYRTDDEELFNLIGVLDPVATKLGLAVTTWGLIRDQPARDEIAHCGIRIC